LFTWGSGGSGILGNFDTTNRSTPVTTSAGGTTWKQVSCGRIHTAAIKTDGTLWTWGRNAYYGQLGINSTFGGDFRNTPVTTFVGGTNWKSVDSGGYHTSAIKTDGTLWVWGSNENGQLGINQGNVSRLTPVTTFIGGTTWKSVSGGRLHTVAIKTDGTLWTWGKNNSGELGINEGDVNTDRNTPVTTFVGGTNWKSVVCGYAHTAAIKTDGSLWTWGGNGGGALGVNGGSNRSTPVTTFAGGNNWKSVSCGRTHTAAIKTDGTLWVWGSGLSLLGAGTLSVDQLTPVTTFAGGTNWKSVTCGRIHTAAIKTDGSLWIWGLNANASLGINSAAEINTPVTTFAGGNNWKSVNSKNGDTTAAIKYSPDP